MTEDVNKTLTTPKGKFALEQHIKKAFDNIDCQEVAAVNACGVVVAEEKKKEKTLCSSKLFIESPEPRILSLLCK